MPLTIPIAHDFICPWCWIGFLQTLRLKREFDIRIDWRGYELYPKQLDWPESTPAPESTKPATPSRFALMCFAEGVEMPQVERPHHMRTYNAHQAVEFAKTEGNADAFIEVLYRAYWERGEEINNPDVLARLAEGIIRDIPAMLAAIAEDRFDDQIVDFDDDAYASGVHNVPTFFVGDQRLAEQPYRVLKTAIQNLMQNPAEPIYANLEFPTGGVALGDKRRPYIFINMVSTIDGKIITGERDEPVDDLGSSTDHAVMHKLEAKANAVLVGANSLRATPTSWNPKTEKRIVVTRSGDFPLDSAFINNGEPYVAAPDGSEFNLPIGTTLIETGKGSVDWADLMVKLFDLGVERLNVLGGSELNASLLEAGLVDELFLTLAPKIKLGRDVPTYADGNPLPRSEVQKYDLVEHHLVGSELFLRYRRQNH